MRRNTSSSSRRPVHTVVTVVITVGTSFGLERKWCFCGTRFLGGTQQQLLKCEQICEHETIMEVDSMASGGGPISSTNWGGFHFHVLLHAYIRTFTPSQASIQATSPTPKIPQPPSFSPFFASCKAVALWKQKSARRTLWYASTQRDSFTSHC